MKTTLSVNYKYTKYACYLSNLSMSVVGTISSILFVTFRDIYNLSYTQLGFLVLINFCTQLFIDLIFSFFSHKFNIEKTVRTMPVITFIGLLIYSVFPKLFPSQAFIFLTLGTVIFSVSAGLNEVLTSPVIAALPSDNPEREMSKLHSVYAWGVVAVVIISTLFLKIFGNSYWNYLTLLWSIVPLFTAVLFAKSSIPKIEASEGTKKSYTKQNTALALCVICIFLGGAAECTMTQWISSFSENALGIPKIIGDVFGMALFAFLLGFGRTLYAKKGKNILNVMLIGMFVAALCYFTAGISLNPYVSLIACVIIGLATSMLWPGSLILVGEKLPGLGVTAYALLAAGGDMGGSLVPQFVGIISDKFALTDFAFTLSQSTGITQEQIAIKTGILFAGLFPLAGFLLLLFMKKYFKKIEK